MTAVTPGVLALSMGDPAGIGPEIIVKAWMALREQGPAFMVVGVPVWAQPKPRGDANARATFYGERIRAELAKPGADVLDRKSVV